MRTTLGWLRRDIMWISAVMASTTLSCSLEELRQNEICHTHQLRCEEKGRFGSAGKASGLQILQVQFSDRVEVQSRWIVLLGNEERDFLDCVDSTKVVANRLKPILNWVNVCL